MMGFSLNFFGKRSLFLSILAPIILGACAPTFHCSDGMKGPGCNSVSQVYEDAHQNKPVSQVYDEAHQPPPSKPLSSLSPTGLPQTIKPGDPLRSRARVLRVWMAPWVDIDGDYHDQSYLYLVLGHGRWYVNQARKRIIRHFAPHILPPIHTTSKANSANNTGSGKVANATNQASVVQPIDSQVLK